jgi:hypothetical protein
MAHDRGSRRQFIEQRKESSFMSLPAVSQGRDLATPIPDGLSRSQRRRLRRLQNAELARGIAAATRIHAAAMVAASGIQASGMLGREAAFQTDGDPVTASRLNYIIDQFDCYLGYEVARFGHGQANGDDNATAQQLVRDDATPNKAQRP